MSTHFVCPNCGAPGRAGGSAPLVCSHCKAELPATLRAVLEDAIQREAVPLPAFLMIGRFGTLFVGSIFALLLALAPFDLASYSIGEEAVSGPEFLRRVGFLWGALTITILAISYALWTERWWSRWLMAGYWVLAAAGMLVIDEGAGGGIGGALTMLFFGLIPAAWYLFGKENVVRYFRELERRADSEEGIERSAA